MRLVLLTVLILFSAYSLACEGQAPCKLNAMEVFLPEVKRYPAPNIRIEKFVYQTESGDVSAKVAFEDLTQLKNTLNNISVQSFKESKTSFEVLVQFRLTPSSNSEFKLQTTGSENESTMLASFYDAAAKLTDYKSNKDTVFVFLHYKISPMEIK